jgi:hypothetical protein
VSKAGEQLVEPSALAIGIAEHEHERVLVRHRGIDHVVNAVGYARSLIDQRSLPSPPLWRPPNASGLCSDHLSASMPQVSL